MDFVVACELRLSHTVIGCIEQSFLSKHTDGYLNYRVKKGLMQGRMQNHTCYLSKGTQMERAYLWINPQILGEWPLVSHEQGILHDQVL